MTRRFAVLALLLLPPLVRAGPHESRVGGRTSPDGAEEILLDLPGAEHLKNVAGRDGSGCCVFTSLEVAGRWANVAQLRGFQQKVAKNEPGGGWPEKVDRMLAKYAPGVEYVQYSGTDPALLQLALKTGRMPCVTYGYSPRYGGRVAHMVNLVHYSAKWAAVLDNNFPGEDRYEWMAPDEFLYRWKLGDGNGWAVITLAPPPPPVPVNRAALPRWNGPVVGQCRGGSCAPGGPPALPLLLAPPAPVYSWRRFPDDAGQVALFRDGVQVGGWSHEGGYFRAYDARTGTWGAKGQPPVAPPPAPASRPAEAPPVKDFGVDRGRIPREETYALNGRKVPAHEAHQAVTAGGSLADDSGKWHLTVVGSVAECQRVLDDLKTHPALAPFRDRLLVQTYRPDAWAVRGVNFPAGGHPTLVVQEAPRADGKARVLHAQHDYDDGPEGLAGALRKADPSYDPKKDADLRHAVLPLPQPVPLPLPIPWWQPSNAPHWWAAFGAFLVWFVQNVAPKLLAWAAAAYKNRQEPSMPPPDLNKLLDELLKKLAEQPKQQIKT